MHLHPVWNRDSTLLPHHLCINNFHFTPIHTDKQQRHNANSSSASLFLSSYIPPISNSNSRVASPTSLTPNPPQPNPPHPNSNANPIHHRSTINPELDFESGCELRVRVGDRSNRKLDGYEKAKVFELVTRAESW